MCPKKSMNAIAASMNTGMAALAGITIAIIEPEKLETSVESACFQRGEMVDCDVMDCSNLSLEWKPLANLPDAEGFAGSYAGVSNGALIVAGGANFPEKPLWEGGPKRWTDRVFVMPPHGEGWQDEDYIYLSRWDDFNFGD